MQIDLHVHSAFSARPGKPLLAALGTAESYTPPRHVYDMCRLRGMDMVTITDHDTIEGALEIAHLPGAFVSEEITTAFPEDGCVVHVVALDITEAQHREIGRVRGNIYELVGYLRLARIPHYLAHPLFGPSGDLSETHLQKLLLMFAHLEGRNSTLDETVGAALQRIVQGLDVATIEAWANTHDIEPIHWGTTRYLTGGSDDHGGLGIAKAYTRLHADQRTPKAMRAAFFAGAISPGGEHGNGTLFSHSIYATTMTYFQQTRARSAFNTLLSESPPSESGRTGKLAAVMSRAIQDGISRVDEGFLNMVTTRCHTDEAQSLLGGIGRNAIRETYAAFVDELADAVANLDVEKGIDAVPGLLSVTSVILPYVFGYRHAVTSKEAALTIAGRLGHRPRAEEGCRVAVFTDTGRDINGVALGLRRLVDAMRAIGTHVYMVTCAEEGAVEIPGVVTLPAIRDVRIPFYRNIAMGIPSLVDILAFIESERISVVQVSTPGPLGLTALLSAKMLGLKVVANYHTELVPYFDALTGDGGLAKIVEAAVAWFYRQADRTIVPSDSVIPTLLGFGVAADTVTMVQRGVDARRFHPGKRDLSVWPRHGVRAERSPKVLYVGRVSKEKGLDTLMAAFADMLQHGVAAELIIVGDGPYRAELEDAHQGDHVHFLGTCVGDALAALFASADLFVFPSDTDTFGNAVIEAQASGLPVVVVDKGGPKEQVTPGVDGFVVPAGDTEMLAFAMAKLCLDRGLRAIYGRAARARAARLTMAASAEAHREVYHAVWAGSPLKTDTPRPPAVTRLRPVPDEQTQDAALG